MERENLDSIGTKWGTDKGAIGHDYLSNYQRNFEHLRDAPITLLEIGVAQGASLKTWEEYFSVAKIVGVDITDGCRRFANDRISIEIGSQSDERFLRFVGEKYRPSIIIDDGSHVATHNLLTFAVLFDYLAPAGLYVIEDLYLQQEKDSAYRDDLIDLAADFFARHAVKLCGDTSQIRPFPQPDPTVTGQMARIEFFRRAVLIEKIRSTDTSGDLDTLEQIVERVTEPRARAYMWHTLSTFILNRELGLHRAANAAQKAASLAPSAGSMLRLASILEQQGLYEEALDKARMGISFAPEDPGLRRLADKLETKLP